VMVWDRGHWQPVGDEREGYAKGALKFSLQGEKLSGLWALIRMRQHGDTERGKENWLLIKERDDKAKPGWNGEIVERLPRSALTGRSLEEIAASGENPPDRE
jgi:bifunctional non-homologous end joining protein LigD